MSVKLILILFTILKHCGFITIAVICSSLSPLVSAEPVKDIRYGVGLYYFYQDDYFSSLVELMSAKQQRALTHHTVNAELLIAGISLSYGLDKSAESAFSSLLAEPGISQKQQNQAWYYLGKLIYQQGDYPRAMSALQHIDPLPSNSSMFADSPADLFQQAIYLQAIMLVARGDIRASRQHMLSLPSSSIFWPYYYFNIGSAFADQENWPLAVEAFETVNTLMNSHQNEQFLRDKANTAVGYAHIAQQEYLAAVIAFQRISLQSTVVDKALLGYGLAESKRSRYQQALAPWQILKKQSLLLPAVQEVMLAIPYAYEKLSLLNTALHEYQLAVNLYRQEIAKLAIAIKTFKQQPLEQLFSLTGLDKNLLPHQELWPIDKNSRYISHLIAKHKFQTALRDYYDLTILRDNLKDLQHRHKQLLTVDNSRKIHLKKLVDSNKIETYSLRKKELELRLANVRERFQTASVSRQHRLLQQDDNHPKPDEQLIQLDSQLQINAALLTKLSDTVMLKYKSKFTNRLQHIDQKISWQRQQVNVAIVSREKYIRELAVIELEQQKNQLKQYLARATLSVARLYDLGYQQSSVQSLGADNE